MPRFAFMESLDFQLWTRIVAMNPAVRSDRALLSRSGLKANNALVLPKTLLRPERCGPEARVVRSFASHQPEGLPEGSRRSKQRGDLRSVGKRVRTPMGCQRASDKAVRRK